MPNVVHVVTTARFAGVERYVADVAVETAAQGWTVTVVGGDPVAMPRALGASARWLPGGGPARALLSLARAGRADVCHAHMTVAEAVSLAARPLHRAPVVATRHFAAPRGRSLLGRVGAPWIAKRLARQLAVSTFAANKLETPPDVVLQNAVRPRDLLWRPESRVVLVLQRLEPEKDTLTALRAWAESGLAAAGWTLCVVGDGSERPMLERFVGENAVEGVSFPGWSHDPDAELAKAGMLIAPGSRDSSALAVLEAMAAGVPVIAAAAGGHLETIGLVPGAQLFTPGNAAGLAATLRRFADDDARAELSRNVRTAALGRLSLEQHVAHLLEEYRVARAAG